MLTTTPFSMQKYDLNLLRKKRTQDGVLQRWQAFQLVSQYPNLWNTYIEDLLLSRDEVIQEVSLSFLAKQEELPSSLMPLINRIFDMSIDFMKVQAALVLCRFQENVLIVQKLKNWIDFLVNVDTVDSSTLSNIVKILLEYNPQFYFAYFLDIINHKKKNAIYNSILYEHLFYAAQDDLDNFSLLLEKYQTVMQNDRSRFLVDSQIHYWKMSSFFQWIENALNTSHSVVNVLTEIFKTAGITMPPETEEIIYRFSSYFDLDSYRNDYEIATYPIIQILKEYWEQVSANSTHKDIPYFNIVISTIGNASYWKEQMPTKVRTVEMIFILTLIQYVLVDDKLTFYLQDPSEYASFISQLFYSPFILQSQQQRILEAFFPQAPLLTTGNLKIKTVERLYNDIENISEMQILWKLYSGEWLGKDINWPSLLSQPCSPYLFEIVFTYFKANFQYYVEKGNHKAINYAISIFIDYNSREIIPFIYNNFDYLVRFHFNSLYSCIQSLPDPCYFKKLCQLYQASFTEISVLIRFLATLYDFPLEITIKEEQENTNLPYQALVKYDYNVKLYCNECQLFSLLTVESIYVNERALLQSDTLTKDDIWTDKKFKCLHCATPIEFDLDYESAKEIENIARTELFLSNHSPVKMFQNYSITLLNFPFFQQKSYNPDKFIALATQLQKEELSKQERKEVRTILLKLYQGLRKWDEVLAILEENKEDTLDWQFEKATAEFYLDKKAKARKYFLLIKEKLDQEATLSVTQERLRTKVIFFLQLIDSYHAQRQYLKIVPEDR